MNTSWPLDRLIKYALKIILDYSQLTCFNYRPFGGIYFLFQIDLGLTDPYTYIATPVNPLFYYTQYPSIYLHLVDGCTMGSEESETEASFV